MPLKTATYLGTPASAQSNVFARNAWDMIIYGGKVFVGQGDVVVNTGTHPLRYYDPSNNTFNSAGSVTEEADFSYRIIDGKLYFPSADQVSNTDHGTYWVWDGSTLNVFLSTDMGAVALSHGSDILDWYGNLYSSHSKTSGSSALPIAKSTDWLSHEGSQPTFANLAGTGILAGKFLTVNGVLYVSTEVFSTFLQIDSNGTITSMAQTQFTPGYSASLTLKDVIDLGTTTVFIKQDGQQVNNSPEIFKTTGPGSSTNINSVMPSGHAAMSLRKIGSTVYVLSRHDNGDSTWESRVSSFDSGLTTLTELFHVTLPTFMRSFASPDALVWYLGAGSDTGTNGDGTAHADTGKLYLVDLRTVAGAPTIGTATATGSATATVAFTAPGSNGGSAITGYVATSTPGSHTGGGASSPITVGGLTPNTSYTFTVHATNAIGDSAESSASNSVTTDEDTAMSGGPIFPCSAVVQTAPRVFPNIYVGAGAGGSLRDEGLGVEASLGADAVWALRFQMPPGALPTGTCQLRLLALANATSGVAKVNPKWASVAAGESPSAATLNAEGVQTVTWAAGDNDKFKELTVTLDADTPVAGEIIVMNLTFETASWTLAQVSTWIPSVRWV